MAPSSVCCPGCQKPFFGKQRRAYCTVCNAIWHAESCVPKLSPSQTFVCKTCKCSASPTINGSLSRASSSLRLSSGGEALLTPSALIDVLNEFFAGENSLHRKANSAVDRQGVVLELLHDQVKALQEERSDDRALIKELLQEVALLRSEVHSLSSNLRPVNLSPGNSGNATLVSAEPQGTSSASSVGSYSDAARLGKKKDAKAPSPTSGGGAQVQSSGHSRQSGRSIPSKQSNRSANPRLTTQQLVVGRRSASSSLTSAAQPAANQVPLPASSRCLFITRAARSATPETVGNYLQDVFQLTSFVCTKLKTQHDSCSSFHLAVPEGEFDQLLDADLWPCKVLVHPFEGHLLRRQVDITTNWSSQALPLTEAASTTVPISADQPIVLASGSSPATTNDGSV